MELIQGQGLLADPAVPGPERFRQDILRVLNNTLPTTLSPQQMVAIGEVAPVI